MLTDKLLPLQSGRRQHRQRRARGARRRRLRGLTAFTEVIQDGMLGLLKEGVLTMAPATSFSLSAARVEEFNANVDLCRDRIVLRPQEISNHPELVRRLGASR
jgi:succinyl-CoA:acetate CoA-transferase